MTAQVCESYSHTLAGIMEPGRPQQYAAGGNMYRRFVNRIGICRRLNDCRLKVNAKHVQGLNKMFFTNTAGNDKNF